MQIHRVLITLLLTGLTGVANAHTGVHSVEGFGNGFVHPFLGLDHLLAMLGVGLWAALMTPDTRRLWQLPLAFMGLMVVGGALGAAGLPLAGVEIGIAASVLVLGVLVAGMAKPPRLAALALVGWFALFHGHAHGAEMAQGASFIGYAAGFVAATGLLHGLGILLGRRLLTAAALYRASGALIFGCGAFLLLQAV